MSTESSRERWRRLSPHLERALELTGEERAGWLDALSARDPELAAEIAALLEEHAELARDGFLEGAAVPAGSASFAGQRMGAYRLRTPLGQGGTGSVWLAERADGQYEGSVAVKLLNASLAGPDGEARFRREGSILARLRHPHIARLLDAGVSPAGQPYLVIEHVDGERIDRWCDAGGLGVEARVRLFLDVLEAVAHAHANLIVHRDLKPSNVLVDQEGRVKLLDFGIATLVDEEPGSVAGELAAGAAPHAPTRPSRFLLTPEYAAPEQLTGAAVTTASDVYALGVMLYEVLTGRHPAGAGTSPAALMRAVVETEPPRLSEAAAAGGSPSADERAARRGSTPRRLRSELGGDLENVVAKALEKNPAHRYASVSAFADDLRRVLDHQPVMARAGSVLYRAARFARRHRAGVAAAALVLVLALSGVAGIAWQAREAARQRDVARAQLARASAATEFLEFLLSVGAPAERGFTVTELLGRGEELIDKQFRHDDALRAEMLLSLGTMHARAERMEQAAPLARRVVDAATAADDPALLARALCFESLVLMTDRATRAEAEATAERALALLGESDEHRAARADCLSTQSFFGYFTGEAEPMIAKARAALRELDGSPGATEFKVIWVRSALAYGLYLDRRAAEADREYEDLMAALERIGREDTLAAVSTLNNWALVHYLGDIGKAERLCRRAVELQRAVEGTGTIAPTITFNHAGTLLELARLPEAEALLEETVRAARERDQPRLEIDATLELAELYTARDEMDRAAAALAPIAGDGTLSPLRRAGLLYSQGRLAAARGDLATARSRFVESAAAHDGFPFKIARSVKVWIAVAEVERASGEVEAAASSAGRALELAESLIEPGGRSYLVGLAWAELGEVEAARGDAPAARTAFATALGHLEPTLGADHPATRGARERVSG